MAKIYYRQILNGKITIDDVRPRWKDEVLLLLGDTNTEVK